MKSLKPFIAAIVAFGSLSVRAQQVEFLVTEFNQSIYQTGADSFVGMGTLDGWNWPNFSFFAAIDIESDVISNPRLTGPSFPSGLSLPFYDFGYEAELPFANAGAMASGVQGGAYAFQGQVGVNEPFSEGTSIPSYTPLNERLVTNYAQLQNFDPTQPLTISWQEFTEGQGTLGDGVTPRGWVEIWVDYWDDTLQQPITLYTQYEEPNVNEFGGLPATQTSVTIPANRLTGSQYGYTVGIFFLRVDEFADAQNFPEAAKVHLRSMDTVVEIWPYQDPGSDPWMPYNPSPEGWVNTGNWMGMINVSHAPWIYSDTNGKYIYIPDEGVSAAGAWTYVPAPMVQ